MNRSLSIALILALTSWCMAQQPRLVPDEVRARITDDEATPLPKYRTEAERLLPLPRPSLEDMLRGAPSGTVYTPAEYEFNDGMLIRWGSWNAVLTDLTVGVTTGDPDAIVYVVVTGASQQSSATSTLSGAGADMGQVEFITYTADSVWIRDYGPRFIFEDNARAMVDHTYNRSRPNDNAFTDYLSPLWGETQYDIPLTHGGGNFHLFGTGDAFMTELIVDENLGLSEQDIKDYYSDYQNVDVTIYPGFPTSFDATRHIDMWMLPVADDEVIIGEYHSYDGEPYTITEDAVTDLTSRGYTVYRTPGWQSGGVHYTYTNAVIMNHVVAIPEFGDGRDAQALTVYEQAFPDRNVFQVDCSGIITYAGALHCIVMHVPGNPTTLQVTPGTGLDASGPEGGPFSPGSVVYTLENTSASVIDYSVTKTASWLSITNGSGQIPAQDTVQVTVSINANADTLPSGGYSDTVDFTNLTDHDGDTTRPAELTVGAPSVQYSWDMDTDPGWTTEGQWDWGQPTGDGGEHGNPDPTSGYTGDNVYGYNLSGDYESGLSELHLTSQAIDCSNMSNVSVKFWRWLGVEQPQYDHAYVRASNNGSDWVDLWTNTAVVEDGSWTQQEFDISAVADGKPTVYLRWTMGIADGTWQYCGWNIDDVEIWAIAQSFDPCDFDEDGDVDLTDHAALEACFSGPGVTSPPGGCDPLDFADRDVDEDGDVDLADFERLQAAFTG